MQSSARKLPLSEQVEPHGGLGMTTYSHAHTLVVCFCRKAVFSCTEKWRFSTEKYCISAEKEKTQCGEASNFQGKTLHSTEKY